MTDDMETHPYIVQEMFDLRPCDAVGVTGVPIFAFRSAQNWALLAKDLCHGVGALEAMDTAMAAMEVADDERRERLQVQAAVECKS